MVLHDVLLLEWWQVEGCKLKVASSEEGLQVLLGKLVPTNYHSGSVSSAKLGRRSGSTKPGSGGSWMTGGKFVAS